MEPDPSQSYLIRKFMISTVTDTRFLRNLRKLWREDLVGSSWRWLANKCFAYLDEYGAAPGKNIEAIWASETADPETAEDLERVLSALSSEFENQTEPLNADLLLKEVEKYFSREMYLRAVPQLESAAEAGDLEFVSELVQEISNPPRLPSGLILNPFSDSSSVSNAFSAKNESFVNLGGAAQELVGSQIVEDSFVAFLGKEKVGKTYWLNTIVFSALRSRRNVLLCQCGDLSLNQQIMRMVIQVTGRNIRQKYNESLLMPVMDCIKNQKGECEFDATKTEGIVEDETTKPYPKLLEFEEADQFYKPCNNIECPEFIPTSWFERIAKCPTLDETYAKASWNRFGTAIGNRLRIQYWPTGTASVTDISNKIHEIYEEEGWKPDVVVVDYFDILAPEPKSKGEYRHQENSKWSAGRRLSQENNCSLVTATQATRGSYKKRIATAEDTSEDKRKGAHITALFGLNKDDHDKRRGWLRINPILLRDDEFDTLDQVSVLQLLQRGCPNLGSFWYRKSSK